jgi:hypothetical protein
MGGRVKAIALISAFVGLVVAPAHAFRSTDIESFTDPDFVGFMPKKVVVLVASDDLNVARLVETPLIEALAERGVEAHSGLDLFPPTRPIESYDMHGMLKARGIDSAILIAPSGRSTGSYQGPSTATTNISGNTATTTVTPQVIQTSDASFEARLLALGDVPETTRVAWQAQIQTSASGWIFVSKKGDAKGAVRAITRALSEDGHLAAK